MSSNKELVIQTVIEAGEIGVAGLSETLQLDKGTCRKVALEAVREGRIGVRKTDKGYIFYSSNGAGQRPFAAAPQEQIDDATWKPSPSNSSGSHALVPVSNGATQPFNPSLDAQLRRNARARTAEQLGFPAPAIANQVGPSPGGLFPVAWNQTFAADPTGDETLLALAKAVNRHTAVMQALNAQDARERAAEQQRRADAKAAEEARQAEKEKQDRLLALQAINGLWTKPEPEPVPEPKPVAIDNQAQRPDNFRDEPADEVPQDFDDDLDPLDPASFDDHELGEIDDRARERVRSEPRFSAEQIEDGVKNAVPHEDDGVATVDPGKIWQRRGFSERLTLAEERRKVAKELVAKREAAERLKKFFAGARKKTAEKTVPNSPAGLLGPGPAPTPHAKTWGEWIAARFGANGRKGFT